MKYKNIVVIGACFPDKLLNKYIDKHLIADVPANVLCWKIVKGLRQNGINVHVINEHKLPKYPNAPLFPKSKNIQTQGIKLNCYSYINLPYIDKISKQFSIYSELKKHKPDLIIVYSLHSPYLSPALKYVKRNNIRIITIVPDLPQYMFSNRGIVGNLLKKIDMKVIEAQTEKVDGYVLLTEQMASALNLSVPYTIIEGISDDIPDDCDAYSNRIHQTFVLYSGALSKKYGIDRLVDSFLKANIDCELWLCGDGSYVPELKTITEQNKKIKYLGMLNRQELRIIQINASLLVNPRDASDPYTRFSFPSKTMEYLSSGTPVMMERLPGIPDDYYKYIITVDKHDWSGSLTKFFQMSEAERKLIGAKGKEYVLNCKNSKEQCQKIVKLMENI